MMKRDESLPLIQTKNSLSSNKKMQDMPMESLYTNESSINFANLKKTLKLTKMTKSFSTQDLLLTQKSSIPNSNSTSFLFNGKNILEKNKGYDKTTDNFLFDLAFYKLDYLNKFKKIKTNLYKKKFYNKPNIKNIKTNIKEIKNDIFNENKKDSIDNNNEEENEENQIDFSQNIWEGEINLKNHENYDIGNDNENENNEEIITESNNFNSPETNDIDTIKEQSDPNSNRMSLYLTEMQNINNINLNSNETNISNAFQSNTRNKITNNYNLKKIKIFDQKTKQKNPFNFTRYSSLDNIGRFHGLYRDFKNICRKHYINEKSPSYSFIKSCDKERIICNPLGLLKRKGDQHTLELNNQHTGNEFINCLSSGLKFTNNLNNLEMSNNRLTQDGIEKFFYNIKQNDSFIKNLLKLNISFNNIGELGVEKLINFIEDKNCQLESLNIEGNNLGDKNINKLCICISQYIWNKITYFNAGKNKITKNSEEGLLPLTEKCSELVVLILRNNQIDNNLGTKLIINLNKLYSLKVFDISWNLIGSHLVYPFLYEEAVNFHPNQKNLYNNFELDKIKTLMKMNFHQNPLLPIADKNAQGKANKNKGKNKKSIFNEIIPEIKSVKVPKRKPSNFAVELSNYIKNNICPLIHLNISHNNLSYEDCELISEESKPNKSILGFHVEGNEMEIDPLGFIHPIKKEKKLQNYYSKTQIIYDHENFKDMPKLLLSPINKFREKVNCWICECWKEIEFILDLSIKDIKPKYLVVKIHFDFENYEPCDMIYKKKCFRLIRMCPPGKIKYFFTVDGNPVINCYKEYDYKIKEFEKPIKYVFNEHYIEQYNNIKILYLNSLNQNENENKIKNKYYSGDCVSVQEDIRDEDKLISKTIYVYNFGIRNIIPSNNLITHDYQSTLKYSTPRPENASSRIANQIPWKFTDSIWNCCNYNYEGDSDDFIEKVFTFDFNRGEYDNLFIKENEFIATRNLLKENYRNILYCYINLSSYSGSNLWQITSEILIEWLIDKCDFFDDKYTSKHMIKVIEEIYFNKRDKEDRKTYKNFSSNKYNLIRHTFLSFLINISIDKYINILRAVQNPYDAIKLGMDNYFIYGTQGYEFHQWRKDRYYNEEVDNYLKAFLPLLDGLYHTFSKKSTRENLIMDDEKEETETERKNYNDKNDEIKMSQEDFNNFISTFIDSDSKENKMINNPLIYHISKKIQIDEITNDEFLYLNLIEFFEALCRVIDIDSPAPPEERIEDWPYEKRKEQLLIEKIENIMPTLYKKIDHPNFNVIRDKFISPLKDQITSLYIVDYKNNSFYNGYEKYFIKNSLE